MRERSSARAQSAGKEPCPATSARRRRRLTVERDELLAGEHLGRRLAHDLAVDVRHELGADERLHFLQRGVSVFWRKK